MENKFTNLAHRPLDPRIIQSKPGGYNQPDIRFISGEAMLELLNEAFGPYYSIEYSEPKVHSYTPAPGMYSSVTHRTVERQVDGVKITTQDIDPDSVYHDRKNNPVFTQEVVEIKCKITAQIYNEKTNQWITVVREGFGSATLKPKGEEMLLKTAATDALKKAAFSFGFAAELFFNNKKDRNGNVTSREADYYNEMILGNWTNDTMARYKNEWIVIVEFMKEHGIEKSNFHEVARVIYDDPNARLTPFNVREIAAQIKKCAKKDGE